MDEQEEPRHPDADIINRNFPLKASDLISADFRVKKFVKKGMILMHQIKELNRYEIPRQELLDKLLSAGFKRSLESLRRKLERLVPGWIEVRKNPSESVVRFRRCGDVSLLHQRLRGKKKDILDFIVSMERNEMSLKELEHLVISFGPTFAMKRKIRDELIELLLFLIPQWISSKVTLNKCVIVIRQDKMFPIYIVNDAFDQIRKFRNHSNTYYLTSLRRSVVKDEGDCSICQHPVYNDIGDQAGSMVCNCNYHLNCMEGWLERTGINKFTCPNCRRNLSISVLEFDD